jgi:hypothetical protein
MTSQRHRKILGISAILLVAALVGLAGCQNSNPTPASIGPAVLTVNALYTETARAAANQPLPSPTLGPSDTPALPPPTQAGGDSGPVIETAQPNATESGEPVQIEPAHETTYEPTRNVRVEEPKESLTPTVAFTIALPPTRGPTETATPEVSETPAK